MKFIGVMASRGRYILLRCIECVPPMMDIKSRNDTLFPNSCSSDSRMQTRRFGKINKTFDYIMNMHKKRNHYPNTGFHRHCTLYTSNTKRHSIFTRYTGYLPRVDIFSLISTALLHEIFKPLPCIGTEANRLGLMISYL